MKPSPAFIEWLGQNKMIGLSINRLCDILDQPDGPEKLKYRLAAHGFDFLNDLYFPGERQA